MADYIIYAIAGVSLAALALMCIYCKIRDGSIINYDD